MKRASENFGHAIAHKFSIIIDADAYYTHARAAMIQAKKRIMLVGWDFDARIRFGKRGDGDDGPEHVGAFILWLTDRTPGLEIYLLRWDIGAIKSLLQPTTLWFVLRWMRDTRIFTKLDSHHPMGSSHHQKIISIDDDFAFCGGIDVTNGRLDTRAHDDDAPHRINPDGKAYMPWHDASSAMVGPVGRTMADICRDRWHRAGGIKIAPLTKPNAVWPTALTIDFSNINVRVVQTMPQMPDQQASCTIEKTYLSQIVSAKRHVYIESQYFCSRKIAEAILARLKEHGGPEIIVINPVKADGWLEPIAMDSARARIYEALKVADHEDRLRLYHPVTVRGTPIYVHAKIMIVDSDIVRVGSSNMNNRSMRLDSECDVFIEANGPDIKVQRAKISTIRNDLLAEHLGCDSETVARSFSQTGSLIAVIEELRGQGKTLRPYELPDLSDTTKWLADNEVLDPEDPNEMFEIFTKRGLFRRAWKWRPHWRRRKRA